MSHKQQFEVGCFQINAGVVPCLQLSYPSYGKKSVGELMVCWGAVETATGRIVDDALGGEGVDADLSVGMNDVTVAKVDSHMDDVSLLVAEKA